MITKTILLDWWHKDEKNLDGFLKTINGSGRMSGIPYSIEKENDNDKIYTLFNLRWKTSVKAHVINNKIVQLKY